MAERDVPEGLSSREAQQRLVDGLSGLISRRSTTNWGAEIRRNPFTTLCSVSVGMAGLLLVMHFVVAANDRNGIVLFHGLFLIVLAAFNVALFGWEVYILKTQKIRHLMVRLKPFFDSLCPWSKSDYPKAPISTLRGHLTVPTYRDGALVNVPISLLVEGDVIELDSGVPSPANATLLESDSDSKWGLVRVSADELLPERYFGDSPPKTETDTISFLHEARPVRLKVEDTPILASLEASLQKVSTANFLTKETNCKLCVVHMVVLAVVYVTSLTVNFIRYFTLRDDFEESWSQLILGNPVYTCLPILFLQFPLVWSCTNLYGTARITQLVEHGPLYFRATGVERIRVFFKTLAAMIKLVFLFSHYPDYRIFHVLGTLTSVCAVDKEYLLTSGFPSPERIFFLRTEEPDKCEADKDKGKDEEMEPHLEETNLGLSESFSASCPGIKVEVTTASDSDPTLVKYQRSKSMDRGQVHHVSDPADDKTPSPNLLPLPSPQLDTFSTQSTDSAPYELVTEIFNLSADPTSYSGIAFDEVYWHQHIASLKPIGMNLFATSHLGKMPFYLPPSRPCNELKLHLHKSSCSCSLSAEIGVADFFPRNFKREVLVHTISDPILDYQKATRRRSTPTSFFTHNNSIIHPHVISSVIKEYGSDNALVMSRGSGDLIASCCTDFWDGKELQPMTVVQREAIVDYYNCHSLSAYCIALAYTPLKDPDLSHLPGDKVGLYIPPGHLERTHANFSAPIMSRNWRVHKKTVAESVFKSVQCNQVFLGLVCLQFRPKLDVVSLIEDLYAAGIRFVHFTAENELQAKIFAQKLGLEADWNCFISLAQPSEEDNSSLGDGDSDSGSHKSSLSSSVMSVFQSTMSHIRARLPKGIKNIRPHIDKVDNVPLLVSLFTNCNAETITEMIEIMQENSEVVLCLGNAWNHKNISIFSQADISLSLIPHYVDLPKCTITQTCTLSTSTSSQNAGSVTSHEKTWPSPLELASYLNSASCQLCFGRDSDVSLLSLITESRRILSSIRLGMLFLLGASLTLTLMLLLSTFLFLPPPLNGGHLLWLLVLIFPLIMMSYLSTPLDDQVQKLMPNKKKDLFSNKCLITTELVVLFGSTALLLLFMFGKTLREICKNDISNSTCHPLLGDRGSGASPWNGWGVGGRAEQGFLLAQDVTAFFTSLYLVFLSVRFIHRTQPLWRLWQYTSWQYVVVTVATVLLQLLYFALSQVSIQQNPDIVVISGLGSVPVLVWVLGFAWPAVILFLLELLKYIDKRKLFETQTLLRLQFGTKLGMHSPV